MRSASHWSVTFVCACEGIFPPVGVQEIEECLAGEPARKLGHLHNEHHRAKRTVCSSAQITIFAGSKGLISYPLSLLRETNNLNAAGSLKKRPVEEVRRARGTTFY